MLVPDGGGREGIGRDVGNRWRECVRDAAWGECARVKKKQMDREVPHGLGGYTRNRCSASAIGLGKGAWVGKTQKEEVLYVIFLITHKICCS